jgi:cytochrome c oxidase subunit 2
MGEELHIQVDADYLRRAIRQPEYEIVDDYPAIMPPYDQLSDAEVDAIIQDLLKR